MPCAASRPRPWHHPNQVRRGRQHRSGKCDRQQAGAKQDKTCNGHCEETVRSEFFAHGTPPTAWKSDCQQDQLHTSQTRTIEIDGSILRRYASDTERDRERYTEVWGVCLSRPSVWTVSRELAQPGRERRDRGIALSGSNTTPALFSLAALCVSRSPLGSPA